MTGLVARRRIAAQLALVGGALGVVAGAAQAAFGSQIPGWTGSKDSPVALGLLTVLLSSAALGAAFRLRAPTPLSTGVRTTIAVVLLGAGILCFSSVGRLWYVPGVLMLWAFGFTLAAGGTTALGTVIRAHWAGVLISLLGAFELLMAVSAGPTLTTALGVIGGIALLVAPWLRGQTRLVTVVLLVVGTVPFAAVTWWSLVTPLLAITALAIGLSLVRHAGAAEIDGLHLRTRPIA